MLALFFLVIGKFLKYSVLSGDHFLVVGLDVLTNFGSTNGMSLLDFRRLAHLLDHLSQGTFEFTFDLGILGEVDIRKLGVLDSFALVGVPSNTHESLKPSCSIGERSEDKHGDTVGISRSSEV